MKDKINRNTPMFDFKCNTNKFRILDARNDEIYTKYWKMLETESEFDALDFTLVETLFHRGKL